MIKSANKNIKTKSFFGSTSSLMDYIVENRIPFAVFIGENEIQEGKVKIKCLANGNELMVERSKLVEEIKKLKENPELLKIEKVEKKTK